MIVLIDSSDSREVLAERLRMQGYQVTATADPAEGAYLALSQPPHAVIADLWMAGISGVQLCRLLRAEPATENVPVILRGPEFDQRNKFWAERAGAAAYVAKGRMGDLVRTLAKAIAASDDSSGFFVQLTGAEHEVRDRIAAHLDAALFESVLASEVRGLSICGEFTRLFDLLSQLVAQVASYRWLALSTASPQRYGLHAHPATRTRAEREAREALELADAQGTVVEDEDASGEVEGPAPLVRPIKFGNVLIGQVAMAPRHAPDQKDYALMDVLAREVAGPLRIVSLVEESHRLARIDPLTGLLNRRAFVEALDLEIARCERRGHSLVVMLLDVDHFKAINDRRGHATGDAVLANLGRMLAQVARRTDIVGRWGGEEFVVALTDTDLEGGALAGERFRCAIDALEVTDGEGSAVGITASIGVAEWGSRQDVDHLVDRADRAMYRAKASGRNCVVVDAASPVLAIVHP